MNIAPMHPKDPPTLDPGLYLVATPIGNLEDITLRALRVLERCDVVASEDTRKTRKLLSHFGLHKEQVSFHEHNEQPAGDRLVERLRTGALVALVTSAGTPGISDPGYTLVRRALEAGVSVTAVPGPAALIPALVVSGLPVHAFTFRGFPPRKPGPRKRMFEQDAPSAHTLIFYESSHRILRCLEDALAVFGDRRAALANDLTKKFETVDRGRLSEIIDRLRTSLPKGEFTLVIEGRGRSTT